MIISVLSANLLDNDVLYFVPQLLKNILTELSENLPDFVTGLLDFAVFAGEAGTGDVVGMVTMKVRNSDGNLLENSNVLRLHRELEYGIIHF